MRIAKATLRQHLTAITLSDNYSNLRLHQCYMVQVNCSGTAAHANPHMLTANCCYMMELQDAGYLENEHKYKQA